MSDNDAERLEARFVPGAKGHMFCIISHPPQPQPNVHNVVFVPPFAEEMNSSRRFFASLRRALCSKGYTVIQPDVFGTGDSEGEFRDATFDIWVDDLGLIKHHFCTAECQRLSFVALRSGCLLVHEFLTSQMDVKSTNAAENLLYLQPETSGFEVINTLLRMRSASNRLSGYSSETSASLWKRFEKEQTLRVGGYEVGHKLALQFRDTQIVPDLSLPVQRQQWIQLELANDAVLDSTPWSEHHIASKRFWQSHDIEPEQSTVDAIAALFDEK